MPKNSEKFKFSLHKIRPTTTHRRAYTTLLILRIVSKANIFKFTGDENSVRIGRMLSSAYFNMVFSPLVDLNGFVKDSPMSRLFEDGSIARSKHKNNNYGNFLRLLLLYKSGGLYLDMDVITIKPLNQNSFPKNFAISISDGRVNNAILKFEKNSCFLRYHIKNTVTKFSIG